MTPIGALDITDYFWVRPRLLAPLFPVDPVTTAALSDLAHNNRYSIVTYHPQLRVGIAGLQKRRNDLRVIPALLQTRPALLRLYADDGVRVRRAAALLNDWWNQQVKGLTHTPLFSRLLLPINLYIDESTDTLGARLIGVDLLPCGGYASETERSFWLKRTLTWLRLAYKRAYVSPEVLLPNPSYYSLDNLRQLVPHMNLRPTCEFNASFPASSFSREEGRIQLRYGLMAAFNDREDCTLSLAEDAVGAYKGISVRAQRIGQHVALEFTFGPDASLGAVPHPLSALLPSLDTGHCYVRTNPCKDAHLVFVDSRLAGPKFATGAPDSRAALLKYLGRTIDESNSAASDAFGRRYVEPGVGRAYLVDFMRIDGRPEILDFSVIGGGLTPYARGGYVDVGRPIDGRVTLGRALHRKLCAERLEEAGCRTAPVVAIFELADDHVTLPNGKSSSAALVVRGFRSVLRVKQLDPVACFYHSFRTRPKLMSFLNDERWNLYDGKPSQRSNFQEKRLFQTATDRYGISFVLPRITTFGQRTVDPFEPDIRALHQRFRATRMYAPLLIDVIKMRVAMEMARDPVHEPLTNLEYAQWFAATMGRQLALFHKARFLHDYHQEGISIQFPQWLYTLGENNITLMAEFPDLDTGIFVDTPDEGSAEELNLTIKDITTLATNFESFHRVDLRRARSVVCTLVTIACHGQSIAIEPVLRCFESEYAKALGQ